jgi:bifunctional non-homologous end joining protein LigD
MSLQKYQSKRHFKSTTEPEGDSSARPAKRGSLGMTRKRLAFVVQEHQASHLHYDFRLEVKGELVSFAIPKGFPKTSAERHLAVQVENHPLEYANFEGEIPKGEYGAGTVKIWDKGTYEPLDGSMGKMLKQGKVVIELFGKKLKGKWALVRFKGSKKNWLVIKKKQ